MLVCTQAFIFPIAFHIKVDFFIYVCRKGCTFVFFHFYSNIWYSNVEYSGLRCWSHVHSFDYFGGWKTSNWSPSL